MLRTNAGKLLDLFCCRSSLCRSFSASERCERRCEVSTASGCALSASASLPLSFNALSCLAVLERGAWEEEELVLSSEKSQQTSRKTKKDNFTHRHQHRHTHTHIQAHTDTLRARHLQTLYFAPLNFDQWPLCAAQQAQVERRARASIARNDLDFALCVFFFNICCCVSYNLLDFFHFEKLNIFMCLFVCRRRDVDASACASAPVSVSVCVAASGILFIIRNLLLMPISTAQISRERV